jgi:hypothetical protein
MTIETPQTVRELIDEDPTVRVYRYTNTSTKKTLYAVFPRGQHDDLAWAPEVEDPVLLYDAGEFTATGVTWITKEEAP